MSAATPLPARTVSSNVRAELARIGMPAYKLPDYIGGTRSYWGRRMTGELPFTVNDLLGLAGLCNVHAGVFFDGVDTQTARPPVSDERPRSVRRQGLEPRTRYVDATASEDGIARILPADSNPDPADSGFGAHVIQLPTWRNQPGVIREAVAR